MLKEGRQVGKWLNSYNKGISVMQGIINVNLHREIETEKPSQEWHFGLSLESWTGVWQAKDKRTLQVQ